MNPNPATPPGAGAFEQVRYQLPDRNLGLDLVGEPVPVNGRMRLPDTPGFGVELNPDVALERPFAR